MEMKCPNCGSNNVTLSENPDSDEMLCDLCYWEHEKEEQSNWENENYTDDLIATMREWATENGIGDERLRTIIHMCAKSLDEQMAFCVFAGAKTT